jgi:uncharacterized protein YprB with RNaseH-like and TPR domain
MIDRDERVRSRLAGLMRERALGAAPQRTAEADVDAVPAEPVETAATTTHEPVAIDELFPGREFPTEHGQIFVHDLVRGADDAGYMRLLADLREASSRLAAVADDELEPAYRTIRDRGLEEVVFLDLETGGLAGQPIFLAGLLRVRPGRLWIRQFLVRSYEEEPALIAGVAHELREAPVIVTYNGRSFDLPMLADRGRYHGVEFDYDGVHLDLLHPARRRYRHRYPDCRLVTLEWYVCHRRRMGDVPGSEIPGHFHAFMRDGDPAPLVPIIHHNVLDLVTLAELLGHLAPDPPGPRFVPDWDTIRAEIDGC